jgi:hypothetical protein
MVQKILFALFGRVRLHINQQQISLTYELFEFKFGSRSAPKQGISKLELVYSSVGNPQTIAIWAGTQEYLLGSPTRYEDAYQVDRLTVPELDWLAHELSEWLRLPIQVRRLPPVAC